MSTHRQRKILVIAVQAAGRYGLDDDSLYPFTDEEFERFDGYNDWKIGGENRNRLAAGIREARKRFSEVLRAEVKKLRVKISRRPADWGLSTAQTRRREQFVRGWSKKPKKGPKRLYPITVTRKDRPAKTHGDCSYCGWFASGSICGVCKEAGIDGPVIRGTEARKGGTYVTWRERRAR